VLRRERERERKEREKREKERGEKKNIERRNEQWTNVGGQGEKIRGRKGERNACKIE
jgi:hypothetical protein